MNSIIISFMNFPKSYYKMVCFILTSAKGHNINHSLNCTNVMESYVIKYLQNLKREMHL